MAEDLPDGAPAPSEPDASSPQQQQHPGEQQLDDPVEAEVCTFFVYGTLMDPQVLQAVTKLDGTPQLQDAWVEGYEMKMWEGLYPTLLPTDNAQSRIRGKVWRGADLLQCMQLQRYETSAYEVADCVIHVDGEDEPVKGLLFKWARDPASSQLVEGSFNLEFWQRVHKPNLF